MTRRAPIVIGATVAGLVGLLGFHSRATGPVAGSGGGRTGSSVGAGTTGGGASAGATGSAPTTTQPTSVTETGPLEAYGYGELDVSVTLSGSTITDVSVPTLEVAEPTSQQIADRSIPVLRREVLAAQSADVAAVSGATMTSRAYLTSLQAALDKAGRS